MSDQRKELIGLLGKCPCDGPEDIGCPDRKCGACRMVDKLDYCAVTHLADHLIANGVVISKMETATIATDNPVGDKPTPTNADRLRSMTDEELAKALNNGFDGEYCTNDPACGALLDADGGIPEEKCIACALRWLRQPAKEA